jgi:hypothetical protein
MVDKTWQNEWLKLKSVKHKIKTLADARVNRCYHAARPAQEVGLSGPTPHFLGRLAKSAQLCAVQIGTELLLHGTSHTVSGLRAMPVQLPYVP